MSILHYVDHLIRTYFLYMFKILLFSTITIIKLRFYCIFKLQCYAILLYLKLFKFVSYTPLRLSKICILELYLVFLHFVFIVDILYDHSKVGAQYIICIICIFMISGDRCQIL